METDTKREIRVIDLSVPPVENLANLGEIPRPYGFKVAVFPIRIPGGSAGWVRAVAIV